MDCIYVFNSGWIDVFWKNEIVYMFLDVKFEWMNSIMNVMVECFLFDVEFKYGFVVFWVIVVIFYNCFCIIVVIYIMYIDIFLKLCVFFMLDLFYWI